MGKERSEANELPRNTEGHRADGQDAHHSITDPWQLLEELDRHRRMRVRAKCYPRFVALTAKQPTAQQEMLAYDARRVFHVRGETIRLDLERSRLIAQIELLARADAGALCVQRAKAVAS